MAPLLLTLGTLALSTVAVAAQLPEGAGTRPTLGGFYTDPNHYKGGTFAGTRMISDALGDKPGDAITLLGSDDGAAFWTLHGRWTDISNGQLTVDFSPKGGPGVLRGAVSGGQIVWDGGANHWQRLPAPAFAVVLDGAHLADVGGFYVDPNHYKDGSFAGTRMISDEAGDVPGTALTLVGSDDGESFWTLSGAFEDKATGAITVDFSPKGGPSNLKGTFANGAITWSDGNQWTRQAVKAASAPQALAQV